MVAIFAVIYSVFLVFAGGMKFLVLSFLIYAPGTLLYLKTRTRAGQAGLHQVRMDRLRGLRRRRDLRAVRPDHGLHHHLNQPRRDTWQKHPQRLPRPPRPSPPSPEFGVHSEVGQLRKVMVCAPGRGARPADAEQLRPAAVRRRAVGRERQARPLRLRHQDARPRRRRGGDAQPAGRDGGRARRQEVDPRQPGGAQPGGPGLHRRAEELPQRAGRPRAGRDADRRPVDARLPRKGRRQGAEDRQGSGRRHRVPAAAAAEHAVHARHHLLDLRRRDAEPAVLAGAAGRDHPDHGDLQVPPRLRRQGQRLVGRPDRRTTAWPRWKAAMSCPSARASC